MLAFIAGSVLSGGLLYVVSIAYPDVRISIATSRCSANTADFVFTKIEDEFGKLQRAFSPVWQAEIEGKIILFAEICCRRYYATEETRWTLRLLDECPLGFAQCCLQPHFNEQAVEKYRVFYGKNHMKLPTTSVFDILITQLISPFFLFQYFSVILWCYENYVAFSMVILAITIGAIYTNTMEQAFNLRRLHDMAGKTSEVVIQTPQGEKEVQDDSLAPGDRFFVKEGMSMPCDAIIYQGRVVVDESMLTGESAPISKTPFDLHEKKNEEIDAVKHAGHILFSGTKIRKVTPGSVVVVYRTGFRSAKGQLVASLLVTKEDSLGFFSDALYVIVFMFVIASVLYLWASMYLKDLGTFNKIIFYKTYK
jgi:magnesium-transporting ATPase (P-type)